MSIRPLADADAACGAKAHGLARLIAAGLPVPDGFVIEPAVFRDLAQIGHDSPDAIGHALAAAAARIAGTEVGGQVAGGIPADLAREVAERAAALGRLAVRSSASLEDGAAGAAAGVFASVTDVAPADVWAAVRAVWTSALTPLAVAYARRRGAADAISIAVIVQRFVPGEPTTVYTRPIGQPRGGELWLERARRDGGTEAIDRIARDAAAGSRDRPEAALALAAEAAIDRPDGADVELVRAGGDAAWWVVQARPIVHPVRRARPSPPPIVVAALVQDGRRWSWDIAHNPDPLSPAQAGLVDRIDRTAWSPYAMRVCGGYLYTAPRAAQAPALPPPIDAADLAARIAEIELRLAAALGDAAKDAAKDAAQLGDVAAAIDRYVAFQQIWVCELSPLVSAARRKLIDRLARDGYPPERIPAQVAAWIGPRRAPRDLVMSPAWDVAVPTFGEAIGAQRGAASQDSPASLAPLAPPAAPPDHLAAEVALARAAADAGERDDVWFARAQWLVRRALLARSRELDLHGDDVFWIPLDDAVTLRSLDPDDVHRRASAARAAASRAAEWDMPLTVHGACDESPRDPRRPIGELREPHEITLRGTGAGPRAVGRVVRFASLAAARPVTRGDVVVTRAVTPALAMLVDGCAALVSETGGLLDHGASLARELGATCVVGCTGAWSLLADGAIVTVDGDAGVVIARSTTT